MDLIKTIERHSLIVARSGYGGWWEISVFSPGGHYREYDTRALASGKTLTEAFEELQKNYPHLCEGE